MVSKRARLALSVSGCREERLRLGSDLFCLLLDLAEGYQLMDSANDDVFTNLSIFTQRLAQEDERVVFAWNPSQLMASFVLVRDSVKECSRCASSHWQQEQKNWRNRKMSEKLEKEILQEVLTPAMVNEIWTTNYTEAIAFTLQDFSVGALLPAVFYMFRRGYRRGQGNFAERYKPLSNEVETERGRTRIAATVASVARVLSGDQLHFNGFESSLAQNILADFLLTHCLENQRHESGRKKPIIRAFPTHYQAAWMDLPAKVSDLRLVPESLVAILADQTTGESIVGDDSKKSFFRVKDDFSENILLSVFGAGMSTREKQSDLVDEFDESIQMGLDQLATIRVARNCDQPIKLKESGMVKKLGEGRGSSQIGNQHPIARQAARSFREDFRLFLQAYVLPYLGNH